MKFSEDKKVHGFLEETMILNDLQFRILQKLRKIVFEIFPDTKEKIMYGGIIFTLTEDFGGIFTYKNHVSFEFSTGFKMDDPNKLLEGKGKFRRHLKFQTLEDVQTKKVESFVQQAV